MTKTINVSDKAYAWLLNKASRQTMEAEQNISMADVLDELIKKGG